MFRLLCRDVTWFTGSKINISHLLQDCKYSLCVWLYKGNRVCSASRNCLAPPLSGFFSSSTNKDSLAQQGYASWHGQPSHYTPPFPAPDAENIPEADWGMEFQELSRPNICHGGGANWRKKKYYGVSRLNQLTREEKDVWGGRKGRWVPELGRGWTVAPEAGEEESRSVSLSSSPGKGVLPQDE